MAYNSKTAKFEDGGSQNYRWNQNHKGNEIKPG